MSSQTCPNIILIITDQQRYDTIAALGAPWMRTPNLDRLAQEGVAFTDCFCTAPSCVPARASFFNGCYPHTLDVLRNADRWEHSWVEGLAAAGYHCVNIGKMHTVPFDAPCGFHQRFVVENKDRPLHLDEHGLAFYDEWDKFLAHNGQRKPSRHTYKAEYPGYAAALGAYEWPLEERYHPDVFVGDMALWWIGQRRAKGPLFLQIGFPGPHPPYDPVARHLEPYRAADVPVPAVTEEELAGQPEAQRLYREEMISGNHDAVAWKENPAPDELRRLRRFYAANVSMIDEQIGRILERLEERGYLENTVVVFTSDHGDCLGDHGHIQKWTMYDCVTRAPMIVWSPKRFNGGRRVDALLQQFDVAAALLETAGVEPPPQSAARSALPLLRGETTEGRDCIFAEHVRDNILEGVDYVTMVRSHGWKLVHYLGQDEGELYDLAADPGEARNLWSSPACREKRDELLRVILDWRIRAGIRHKL